ncbi:hypothetical protein [Enterobacter roggenkampii]|uniref:hypothetical protein n=1 Tax=Enterobacter roggenkampii TaxID=1812935 RepID=UPI0038909ABA
MINERLTIERLSEVLKNMQGYTARERRIGEFDGGYIVERVDPTFIDCVTALTELLEYRKAQNPVLFIGGDISPADAEKLAALLRECRGAIPALMQVQSQALRDVTAERQRQQSTKGYSTQQDDTYIGGELAAAAISYIEPMEAESYWPADWHDDSFKPSDYRRNLVKAGALILAEIERIDRQEQTKNDQ